MKDPIDTIQTHAWYWNLVAVSGLNDYQLYLACFADHGNPRGHGVGAQRTRIFERVRVNGTRPDRRDKRRNFILLDVVEHHFPGTRYCFDHVLWKLLTPPAPSLARVQLTIKSLLPLTGFFRAPSFEAEIAEEKYIRQHGLVNLSSNWIYETNKNALTKLSNDAGYDQLALLTCLALETRAYLSHEDMMLEMMESFVRIAKYCESAFGNFAKRREITPVRDELWKLYKSRIIGGHWDRRKANHDADHESIRGALDMLLPLEIYGRHLQDS